MGPAHRPCIQFCTFYSCAFYLKKKIIPEIVNSYRAHHLCLQRLDAASEYKKLMGALSTSTKT